MDRSYLRFYGGYASSYPTFFNVIPASLSIFSFSPHNFLLLRTFSQLGGGGPFIRLYMGGRGGFIGLCASFVSGCCDEFGTRHMKYCREENDKMVYEKVRGRREGERIQIENCI